LNFNLDKYKTVIFDCDGVVLNSNFIKAKCFYLSVKDLGDKLAKDFINYHKNQGGLSRVKKYDYLIDNILPKYKILVKDKRLFHKELISKYELLLQSHILKADLSPFLKKLREQNNSLDWIMISGSNQIELREILKTKGIYEFFNLGIFGSPPSKESLLKENIIQNKIKFPAIFLGDSKLDYYSAKKYDIDFLFLYEWTDLSNWKKFCSKNSINYAKNLEIFL